MALVIDDAPGTAFLTIPAREGWIDDTAGFDVRAGLRADDIGPDDIAVVPLPEATLLTRTHVIDRAIAIVHDGAGLITMRTRVRPDEIEATEIHLAGVGAAGETLTRALMRSYFGIEATGFAHDAEPPEDADVVVTVGPGKGEGFREDLARSWFIMTGKPYVSHVTVIGVEALARDPDADIARLIAARDAGWERRRDVRRVIRETTGVDADTLADVTARMRFALTPDDQEPARMLVERGTWGMSYGRTLPAFRDQLPAS